MSRVVITPVMLLVEISFTSSLGTVSLTEIPYRTPRVTQTLRRMRENNNKQYSFFKNQKGFLPNFQQQHGFTNNRAILRTFRDRPYTTPEDLSARL